MSQFRNAEINPWARFDTSGCLVQPFLLDRVKDGDSPKIDELYWRKPILTSQGNICLVVQGRDVMQTSSQDSIHCATAPDSNVLSCRVQERLRLHVQLHHALRDIRGVDPLIRFSAATEDHCSSWARAKRPGAVLGRVKDFQIGDFGIVISFQELLPVLSGLKGHRDSGGSSGFLPKSEVQPAKSV